MRRRPSFLGGLVLALAWPGTPARAADEGRIVSERTSIGGVERHALVYVVPPPARGLVLLLHGHGGSAAHLLEPHAGASPYRVWKRIADREGLVLVAPDGLRGGDRQPGWNDCRGAATNPAGDDVGYLDALVRRVAARHRVDERHLFVVGTSNGGVMTLRLAVERPHLFRAFAAIVAELPASSVCKPPTVPVPVLLMNGTADPLMPWDGGNVAGKAGRGAVLSTDRTVAFFTALNHAAGEPRVEALPDLDPEDGSRVTRLSWSPAGGGAPVVLVRVEGGGHVEPSRTERYRRFVHAALGSQNGDIEAAEEVWRFFAAQRTPAR